MGECDLSGGGVGECDLPERMRQSAAAAGGGDGMSCCCLAALSRWLMAATDADKFDLDLVSFSSDMI